MRVVEATLDLFGGPLAVRRPGGCAVGVPGLETPARTVRPAGSRGVSEVSRQIDEEREPWAHREPFWN